MRALSLVLLLGGCVAAPPPPAAPGQLGGCHPGAYSTLSELACERDSDCLVCGRECRLDTRESLMLSNASCPAGDACDARPACCNGRCVESLGAPTF